ncbi:hypothetical protein [Mycolicibacterium sp. P1-18]|uniref:hypothetical protein n=1 Tax=Mycolicibacterium sp. P1-18 TaxID=2024615 RepID=UPI001F5BC714|nr:hypothetical protein [Mycolicibacterium sp. P1-18]
MTAALAVAAHGTAGGGLPSGPTAAMLALLSLTLGALVTTIRDGVDVRVLVAVLAVGQLLSHVLLGAGGHAHTSTAGAPALPMLGAHLVAVAVGAALIAAGGRLAAALSRVLVVATRLVRHPVAAPSVTAVASADQPLQSARLLSASLSHRGPPVVVAS